MPHISPDDFDTIERALLALQPGNPDLDKPVELMRDARERTASPELRLLAHETYGTDDVEIDDEGVSTSTSDCGIWVSAWVFLTRDELVEAGIACATPGCDHDPNTGEGFDGYCGSCADRRETECAET